MKDLITNVKVTYKPGYLQEALQETIETLKRENLVPKDVIYWHDKIKDQYYLEFSCNTK